MIISKTAATTTTVPTTTTPTDSQQFIESKQVFYTNIDNPTCSLRRSRSLAVIREETFNDLSITSAKTRRSQLIPRAKLVDRNFFKDR